MKKFYLIILLVFCGFSAYFARVKIKDFYYQIKKPDIPDSVSFQEASSLNNFPKNKKSVDSEISAHGNSQAENIAGKDTKDGESIFFDNGHNSENSKGVDADYFDEYNLSVPFAPQAPFGNWDMPYQEACEEASLIMADAFFKGYSLSSEKMEQEIKNLVEWETGYFGYYQDTTTEEVVEIAKEYFGLESEILFDVSVENIKKIISRGKLVIVPAAGRILPNPYFTGQGPIYHMLVIRGYTKDKFITNDPGTKRGEEFLYEYDDLLNAVHDWPRESGGEKGDVKEEEMLEAKKVLIVVWQEI